MQQQLLKERQIRPHAADTELAERATHPGTGLFMRAAPRGHFYEHRVVVTRNTRARIRCTRIEANAKTRGAAIGRHHAVVRNEIVFRILRRDAALHGVTVRADLVLNRHAAVGLTDRRATGNQYLRFHEVDARDVFGHRVFDLDTRIHLDEIELAGVDVFEELDGAGVLIADRAADRERVVVQLVAARLVQEQRGCPLNDFLMAPLHRAVALEEMHEVAVRVGEDLHFDVARARDRLLEIHLVVAERGQRFVARGREQLIEQFRPRHRTRAATTAAPTRLHHQWKADVGGEFAHGRDITR